jgi:predicted 3-demethylubiquinone-9 3-methyltransferase (glyoxalase superfamily)
MTRSVATFLMFEGAAEEAMNFYVSLFKGSEIVTVERYGPGGQTLMPPGNYGFSTKFGWVNDRFGVSWQLNLR